MAINTNANAVARYIENLPASGRDGTWPFYAPDTATKIAMKRADTLPKRRSALPRI
jgi:hypothetical protein